MRYAFYSVSAILTLMFQELIIPYNDSISLSIDKLCAKTKITVSDRLANDSVSINGVEIDLKKSRRFSAVFKVRL